MELTPFEAAIAVLYGVFKKYASGGEEGDDPTTMCKKECSTLLKEQVPSLADVSHTSYTWPQVLLLLSMQNV